jgi:trehalose-6-phosphate synthase
VRYFFINFFKLVWVNDYHLMLLPGMIREKIPNATIGFFLHIPFPSSELFRCLPRKYYYSVYRID